jgi:hypothetical protein
MKKVVVSKAAIKSVTIGTSDIYARSIHNNELYRLIDTQGFGDGDIKSTNESLWEKLL